MTKRALNLEYSTVSGRLRTLHLHPSAVEITEGGEVRLSKWVAFVCDLLNGKEDEHAPSTNMDPDTSHEAEYVYVEGFFYLTPYGETAYETERERRKADRDEHRARNRSRY